GLALSRHRRRRVAGRHDLGRLALGAALLAGRALRAPVLPRSAAGDPAGRAPGARAGRRPRDRHRDDPGSLCRPAGAEDLGLHERVQRALQPLSGRRAHREGPVFSGQVPERRPGQGFRSQRAQRAADPHRRRRAGGLRAGGRPGRAAHPLLRGCRRHARPRPALRLHPFRLAGRPVPADRCAAARRRRGEGLRLPRRAGRAGAGAAGKRAAGERAAGKRAGMNQDPRDRFDDDESYRAGPDDDTGGEPVGDSPAAPAGLAPQRSRRIYILPNAFTTANLFCGFYAIVQAMNGRFEIAAIALFVAMLLDSLDGRVARLTNTQSAFGEQYDSLSDMLSFGAAPALIVYEWALQPLGKWGWLAAFVYVAGAALRLARFN